MVRKRRKKARPGGKVVDLAAKRTEKVAEELESIMGRQRRGLDEQARLILDAYHDWERANPDDALPGYEKMAMVRFGFIGPGGFERCHEAHRLPEHAFFTDDGDVAEEIRRDRGASEVLMCPAMQTRRCQPAWRGARLPPCYLLLLEVHQGLGGDAHDDSVQEVVEGFGKWRDPEEEYAASFVRAEQLLRHFEERDDRRRNPEKPPPAG